MTLLQHHREELEKGSAIHRSLVDVAFSSIEELALFNTLYPEPENGYPHLNGGRLNSQWQRRYNNCMDSIGWQVGGVEPLTGEPSSFTRVKPDPGSRLCKIWDKEKQAYKNAKYLSPLGVPSRLIFLPVTPEIIEIIRGRCRKEFSQKNIERFREKHPEMMNCIESTITPKNFWLFVIENPKIPIALAEGEKKAASLLSIGVIAIALPGIRMGYRRKLGELLLVDDLKLFASPDRAITFYFDNDVQEKTRKTCEDALEKTARLLLKEKCKVSVAHIPLLDEKKGAIDDFLALYGEKGFNLLKVHTFVKWQFVREQKKLITYLPKLTVNTDDMGRDINVNTLPKTGLIALAGAKAVGKTKLLEELTKGDDIAVLSLGHRIFLQKGLCERLGLEYRGDVEKVKHDGISNYIGSNGSSVDRLAGCSEGLIYFYSVIRSQFLLSDKRKVLVLDEADQVFISLLLSSTCDKDGIRPVLLSIYEEIIRASDLIILASADISDAEINWVLRVRNRGITGDNKASFPVFYIKNEYKSKGYIAIFVKSKEEVIELAKLALESGENIWFIVDTKALSKEIFDAFEPYLKEGERGILINGDTSKELEQCDFIRNISNNDPQKVSDFLKPYRFVIATQSLWTSASITVNHFTEVFACFSSGICPDWDMSQSLSRVRPNVPRTIFCADKGQLNDRYSGFYKNQIKKNLRDMTDINNRIIAQKLSGTFDPILNYNWELDDNPHIDLFCHYIARDNCSKIHLQERLEARLEYEGNEIIHESFIDAEDLESAKAEAKSKRLEKKAEEDEDLLFKTPLLSETEAKELSAKHSLTKEQEKLLNKYHFVDFYKLHSHYETLEGDKGNETIKQYIRETHAKDNGGRLRARIKKLEYLRGGTEGYERAIFDDVKSINRQAKHGKGLFAPDLKRNTSQIFALNKTLNFSQYLDPDKTWTEETLVQLVEDCKKFKEFPLIMKLPKILGGNIGGVWLLSQLLLGFGIKTKSRRVQIDGERKSVLSIDREHWEWVEGVLTRRSENFSFAGLGDLKFFDPIENLEVVDPPINNNSQGGSATELDNTPIPKFDELGGMILVEAKTGRPDIPTKRTNFTTWTTIKKAYISRNDLQTKAYRLPTVEDVARWAREAIREASQTKARWLFVHFGEILENFPDLVVIYNFA
ncbi:plasmid replication protein, CyRepA1 family [Planktothrix sp. FACHB-1365]|uniref:plasmid replication protein, CyRepA1 family n=1 Tax=Planktothrix sp. FACHB-1365 TaxID=2692855 RepID=UPI0016874AAF|nr:plasmid replication protein, CyRepA1 family [Planktothrix sp. FACHB-1365]MBD2485824.1 DUF3854 domain-containing protein [Planktothrix sp. FACHB-1365]